MFEILGCFQASNILEEIKVSVSVDAGTDHAMPVNTLQFDVRIVLLEVKVQSTSEVDVGTLNCMHVLTRHFKLVEIEVFGEYLHLFLSN